MPELCDMVKRWLQDNRFDGLCHSDSECGCSLEDLMLCGEPSPECEAAYSAPPPKDSDADTWFSPTKPKEVQNGNA